MTYSFVNSSDEKFQQVTNSSFQVNAHLLAQAKAPRLETKTVQPASAQIITDHQATTVNNNIIEVKPGQKLLYDLGSLYVGRFSVDCSATGSPMDAPLLLNVRFAETRQELDVDASQVKSWLPLSWIQDETLHVDLLPQQLAFPRRYSCRYICLEPVGQSLKWQPQFTQPQFTAESAVLNEQVAPLIQAPSWIQQVDQACVATLRNTMQYVFEDGTKRDQRLWVSDFRIQARVNYVTFHNQTVPKRCLYLLGSFLDEDGRLPADVLTRLPQPVADDLFWFDYDLVFIMALAEYVSATADHDTAEALYPVAKRVMQFIESQLQADLTVGPRQDIFVDWSTDFDKEAAVQAQVIMAVTSLIVLAKTVNDPDITHYQQLLTRLETSTRQVYYDAQQHLFTSGPKQEINPLSQVYMLLTDLLTEPEAQQVIDQLLSRFDLARTLTTPSTQGLLAEALFKHGRRKEALSGIKHYWTGMLKRGADTFWEVYDENDPTYSPYGSILLNGHCFGWSSYPAYLFRKYQVNGQD
ncbi:alpha-L-rhamnosidase [Secundilactobacillus pentosiphilus]|uniref:Alpha-L-rhamnosidase n=1 Tax=Secundilactobacillus pentosiphilus TaxID=1714682 RepID=A0A1Z5IQ94_9LACO|nr:family 78 glycoside hydrolase catalytic domain [Secundilactobacillus pentosiphilus]GAX03934.1 alpha-L-rhamnosidase [Secundilactobacillus pentosiphilus]